MSNFAGNLPSKFISFFHSGFKFFGHSLPEERESENLEKVDEIHKVNTAVAGETSINPTKFISILQNVPMSSEILTSRVAQKDHDLTVAEKDCVLTISEEDMNDLNAFENEKLQFMTEKGLEQLVGDGSMNVE